jgi:hypothetical protein
MGETLKQIQRLVAEADILVSNHGYDELAMDDILVQDVIDGVNDAAVIEDYPNFYKGPCVLVRQFDHHRRPIHVVWGIPKERTRPAVVVTAYRPDPARWRDDFMRRVS